MQVIVSGLECAVDLVFAALYFARVRWHNQREAIPDAQLYLQSALYTAPESGLRCDPFTWANLVELHLLNDPLPVF